MDVHEQAPLRRFTLDEYHRLLDCEVLKRGSRVELLDGLVLDVPPPSRTRLTVVSRVQRLLADVLPDELRLLRGEPLSLSGDTEVAPDLAVVTAKSQERAVRNVPTALFVVEVADERLEAVRELRFPAYARAGVAEAWLVNLPDRRVEVARRPQRSDGTWADALVLTKGDLLTSSALRDISWPAVRLLGS